MNQRTVIMYLYYSCYCYWTLLEVQFGQMMMMMMMNPLCHHQPTKKIHSHYPCLHIYRTVDLNVK